MTIASPAARARSSASTVKPANASSRFCRSSSWPIDVPLQPAGLVGLFPFDQGGADAGPQLPDLPLEIAMLALPFDTQPPGAIPDALQDRHVGVQLRHVEQGA